MHFILYLMTFYGGFDYYIKMINKTLPFYFLLLLGSLSLFSCSETDEQALLNQHIDGLIAAIEKHDLQQVKTFLSSDFSTIQGMNKTKFMIFAKYQLKRHNNVLVNVLDKDVILNKDKADMTAKVLLIGADGWLPERGQVFKVASRWKKESGDWVMSRLRWEKDLD